MKKILSSFFFALFCSCLSDRCLANEDLDHAINDALGYLNVRGAAIAFFDKNKNQTEPIVRGYGRVGSADSAEKVTPDTVFMIASVSKVFAGAAVLVLVDQGKITLDDDICNIIPEDWDQSACRNPNYPNIPVTWRMLVTHRSSLRENIPYFKAQSNDDWIEAAYGPTGGYVEGSAAGHPTCPMDDVSGFYRDFLIDKETETTVGADLSINWYQVGEENGGAWENFEPGSKNLYSNFAVGYIAALVEFVSGQPFSDFCRDNIFAPLGMTRTAWFRRDLPEDTLEAIPNEWIRRKRFEDVGHYCFIDYASGSLHTSASDMAKFLDAMLDYGAPLWSNETGQEAVTCQELTPTGVPVKNCEFGVNWILMDNSQKDGAEFWLDPFLSLDWSDGAQHDGAEAGCQTQIVVLPKAGVYAVVFTNTDLNDDWAAQEMTLEILDSLGYTSGGEYRWGSIYWLTAAVSSSLSIMVFWWYKRNMRCGDNSR